MRATIVIAALILSFSSQANERHQLELSFCSITSGCLECSERVRIDVVHENQKIVITAKDLSGEVFQEPLDSCTFTTPNNITCDLGRALIKKIDGKFTVHLQKKLAPGLKEIEVCVRNV